MFVCFNCNEEFNMEDDLNIHMDNTHEIVQPRRNRVVAACDECSLRRAKCVGRDPCERCASLDRPCTYNRYPDRASARPLASEPQIDSRATFRVAPLEESAPQASKPVSSSQPALLPPLGLQPFQSPNFVEFPFQEDLLDPKITNFSSETMQRKFSTSWLNYPRKE